MKNLSLQKSITAIVGFQNGERKTYENKVAASTTKINLSKTYFRKKIEGEGSYNSTLAIQ